MIQPRWDVALLGGLFVALQGRLHRSLISTNVVAFNFNSFPSRVQFPLMPVSNRLVFVTDSLFHDYQQQRGVVHRRALAGTKNADDDDYDVDEYDFFDWQPPPVDEVWYSPPSPVPTTAVAAAAVAGATSVPAVPSTTNTVIAEKKSTAIKAKNGITGSTTSRPLRGAKPHITAIQSRRDYEHLVNNVDDDRLVVIKFYASWCKACAHFGLKFDRLAARKGDWIQSSTGRVVQVGSVRFAMIEYGTNQELCQSLGISKLPTVDFMQHGQLLTSFDCAPNKFHRVEETVEYYLQRQQQSETQFQEQLDKGLNLVHDLYQHEQNETESASRSATKLKEDTTAATTSSTATTRSKWINRLSLGGNHKNKKEQVGAQAENL